MSSKNTIFYYDFKDDNNISYSLRFVPADSTNVSNPTMVKLPSKCIFPEISLSYAFEDNLPKGLALAKSLKFSIDLSLFTDSFSDVGDWIFRNYPVYTYNSRTIIIPNHWYLLRENKIIFDGFSDIKPNRQIDIEYNSSGERSEKLNIECMDTFRVCSERALLTDIDGETNARIVDNLTMIPYFAYPTPSKVLYSGYLANHYFLSNNNFNNALFAPIQSIALKLTRGLDIYDGDLVIGKYNVVFDNVTYYSKIFDSLTNTKGTALNSRTDIELCTIIKDESNVIIGGLLSNKSTNSFINEYKNCWDLIKALVSNSYQKAVIVNGIVGSGSGNKIAFLPVLNDLDLDGNNLNFTANKVITKNDIKGKSISIEYGYKNISNANFVLKDLHKDLVNDFKIQSGGILNESSQDIKLALNNINHLYDSTRKIQSNTYYTERTYIRNLYYHTTTNTITVDSNCDINIGTGGTAYSQDLGYLGLINFLNDDVKIAKEAIDTWNLNTGIGKAIADLDFTLFSGEKQAYCELELDNVTTNNLGDIYTFDSGILRTGANVTSILCNVDLNIKSGIAKCGFFIIGNK